MVCTSRKIRFHTRNKSFVENTSPAYGKTASSGKKIEENGFHLQENVFLLKSVSPNFNNAFQQQKKNSE